MRKIVFIMFVSLAFFACKKKEADKMGISGQVLDPYQNTKVQGVKVDLYVKKIESGLYSGGYTLVQSLNSDASGNFSFSFDPVMASSYKLSFSKTGFFNSEQEISSDKIIKGSDFYQQYSIHSEAYLKLHVKNNAPTSSLDRITFRLKKGFLNSYKCCWDSFYTYEGSEVDYLQKCKVYGSQHLVFEWTIINSSATLIKSDSVFCNPFDTTSFEILY